jgi:hypothetical protein
MDFDETISSFNGDSSLEKSFISLYLRNNVPNLINEQNVKKCLEVLNLKNETAIARPMNKILIVLKPLFVNFECLSIQKIIDLLDFFYKVTLKQFELFKREDTKMEM